MISVIIPVYNSAAYIGETLDSVIAQRGYCDGEKMEIILVDDGSSDDTVEVIRNYVNYINSKSKEIREKEAQGDKGSSYVNHKPVSIRIIPNADKKGAAGARNTGIDEAKGEYIAFIDADDKWLGDKLEKQMKLMKETGAAFSFTGYEYADENCIGMGKTAKVPVRIGYREALKNTTIFTSTVILDMKKLAKEDIYFPYIASEDTANWWKILKKTGYAAGLDKPLTLYRRSGGTLSSNKLVGIQRIWGLYMNEGLSVPYSLYCFVCFAFNAVIRRL
jgi:teichuronic acid biosynthesis glycosyltransferase TuaG